MSIQTELARITNAKAAIKTAIEGKGVTVPEATLLDGMAALIESIEAGGGGAEVNIGSFILSSGFKIYGTDGYSITHGLSNSPDLFVLLKNNQYNNSGVLSFYIYYKNKSSGNAVYGGVNRVPVISYIAPTITTETVTIISGDEKLTELINNQEYIWIAMRGLP